jgi:GT2 family glycosyltransferase
MPEKEFRGRVLITRPCYDTYDYENIVSVEGMRMQANREGWGCNFHFCKGSNIAEQRTQGVEMALKVDADYMLCIDSDVLVMQDSLVRLLAHDVDIVSGIVVSKKEPYTPHAANKKDDGTYYIVKHYQKNAFFKVDAVGFGFVLIKTDVLRKIKPPYFKMSKDKGEDFYFCEQAKKAGFDIYVDTACNLAHIGKYYYTIDDYYGTHPELDQKPKLITPSGKVLVN